MSEEEKETRTYLHKWGGYDMTTKPEDRLKKIEQSKNSAKCSYDRPDYKHHLDGTKLIKASIKAEKKLSEEEMEIIRTRYRHRREERLLQRSLNPEKVATKRPATNDDFCAALKEKLEARGQVVFADTSDVIKEFAKHFQVEEPVVEIVKEEVILSKWGRIKLEARNWLRRQASRLIVLLQKI